MNRSIPAAVPLQRAHGRGAQPVRVALVGLPKSGKSTLFQTVASTAVQTANSPSQCHHSVMACRRTNWETSCARS